MLMMKKPFNFKPMLFTAMAAASLASYSYLSHQNNGGEDTNQVKLYEEKILNNMEDIDGSSKLLPDVKLVEKIAKIGKRLLPL
jgi:hypothetical protein